MYKIYSLFYSNISYTQLVCENYEPFISARKSKIVNVRNFLERTRNASHYQGRQRDGPHTTYLEVKTLGGAPLDPRHTLPSSEI